jgi:hypothetical protein
MSQLGHFSFFFFGEVVLPSARQLAPFFIENGAHEAGALMGMPEAQFSVRT